MNIYRIYSLMIRYLLIGTRESNRLFQLIYFPTIDIILWGYMSLWAQRTASEALNITMIYIAAIVLLEMILAINNEQSLNLLEELETRNVVNLFSTPITLGEWIVAGILLSLGKALFTLLFGTGIALFFGVNIFSLGWALIPLVLLLLCSGLALGFFLNGILIYSGQQIAILIWSIPYLILVLSAPFYPVSLLPQVVQYIVKLLPTTYIFESLRCLIENGYLPVNSLAVSLGLNLIYVTLSLVFLIYIFNLSKAHGLAQLEQE